MPASDDVYARLPVRREELHARALDGLPPVADADVTFEVRALVVVVELTCGQVVHEGVVGADFGGGELLP